MRAPARQLGGRLADAAQGSQSLHVLDVVVEGGLLRVGPMQQLLALLSSLRLLLLVRLCPAQQPASQ
jgi:hypothetical protein